MKKNVAFITICFFVVIFIKQNTVYAFSYFGYNDFGGIWHDANKTWEGDSNLCWAAAASNSLAWTGWGFPSSLDISGSSQSFENVYDIFAYYNTCFPNNAYTIDGGWEWWFNGQIMPGYFLFVGSGGGFYKLTYDFTEYFSTSEGDNSLQTIDKYLHEGYGVGLGIRRGGSSGHAITVWGYEYDLDPNNNCIYDGLYITDSDDNIKGLRYYSVIFQDDDFWYIQDLHNQDWKIHKIYGLNQAPFRSSSPLPSAFFLLGSGLLSLAAWTRLRKSDQRQ